MGSFRRMISTQMLSESDEDRGDDDSDNDSEEGQSDVRQENNVDRNRGNSSTHKSRSGSQSYRKETEIHKEEEHGSQGSLNDDSNSESSNNNNTAKKPKNQIFKRDSNLSGEQDSDDMQHNKQKVDRKGSRSVTRMANDKKMAAMNFNKSGDNMNFKRSIEIKNGIAIRSTNNVHKTTNAISLHSYIVSRLLAGHSCSI